MKKEEYSQIETEIDKIANEKKVNISKLTAELHVIFNKIIKEESQ